MKADLMLAIPEISLVVFALLFLMIGAFGSEKVKRKISNLSFFALLVALLMLVHLVPNENIEAFGDFFAISPFVNYMKALVMLAAMVVLYMYRQAGYKYKSPSWAFEFPILVLLSVVGMMITISSGDFLTLYLGLEMQSLCLYIMAAFERDDGKSTEAGLKYFILGSLASGMLLYGISLIYGFAGTTNFDDLYDMYVHLRISETVVSDQVSLGVVVGLVFVLVGFFFKISAAPFHMWTPDVYQGAPTIVTAFFAMVPKVSALAILTKFLIQTFAHLQGGWFPILWLVACLSMAVGALGAIKQTNIKRLLAYSSIGHVGYILIATASNSLYGMRALLIYVVVYVVMSAGAFACVLMMRKDGKPVENISSLAGISKTNPTFAFCLSVIMFSMAGIPPLAGFFGKYYVFYSAIMSGHYLLATVGVITSVVSAYYYLRVVKVMYLDEPTKSTCSELDENLYGSLKLATIFNLIFFIVPSLVIDVAFSQNMTL